MSCGGVLPLKEALCRQPTTQLCEFLPAHCIPGEWIHTYIVDLDGSKIDAWRWGILILHSQEVQPQELLSSRGPCDKFSPCGGLRAYFQKGLNNSIGQWFILRIAEILHHPKP